jgi:hypothetical protein
MFPLPKAPACRLPAMLWDEPNAATQGGFIDSVSGTFTPDPGSVMVRDSTRGLFRTPDLPYLFGTGSDVSGLAGASASYDVNQHRWVPVPLQFVSPDGTAYAYAVTAPGAAHGVHIVNVATGTDRIVASTVTIRDDQANYLVVGYLQDGVYMGRFGQGGPRIGLWRLDPGSGATLKVSTDVPLDGVFVGNAPLVNPPSYGNPVAWWSTLSADFSASSDPHVYYQYLTGVAGQHGETWFERPGFRINVIGVDRAGHGMVVAESENEVEIWLLQESTSTRLNSAANNGSPDLPFNTAVADAGGWWIGGRTGVFFATTAAFTQVSTTPAVVVSGCA